MFFSGLLKEQVRCELAKTYSHSTTPAPFNSDVFDALKFDRVGWLLAVNATAEAPTVAVQESATSATSFAALSPAVSLSRIHTDATALGRLYMAEAKKNYRYQRLAITSTPGTSVQYTAVAFGIAPKEIPVDQPVDEE